MISNYFSIRADHTVHRVCINIRLQEQGCHIDVKLIIDA